MVVAEIQIRSFLTSTVNGDWWFNSRSGDFFSDKKILVILKEC
jgi:hypothetical protein